MLDLDIVLVDVTDCQVEKINRHILSKADYILVLERLYYKNRSRFFQCIKISLDMKIHHEHFVHTIKNFNIIRYGRFIHEARLIYATIKLIEYERIELEQKSRTEKEKNTEFNSNECPICLEPYEEKIYILSCLHKFHAKCLRNSPKKILKCPMCRAEINEWISIEKEC